MYIMYLFESKAGLMNKETL